MLQRATHSTAVGLKKVQIVPSSQKKQLAKHTTQFGGPRKGCYARGADWMGGGMRTSALSFAILSKIERYVLLA